MANESAKKFSNVDCRVSEEARGAVLFACQGILKVALFSDSPSHYYNSTHGSGSLAVQSAAADHTQKW